MKKPKVAFVCVHNSCRSQIAEALGKYLSSNVFDSYSAGTETKPQINRGKMSVFLYLKILECIVFMRIIENEI